MTVDEFTVTASPSARRNTDGAAFLIGAMAPCTASGVEVASRRRGPGPPVSSLRGRADLSNKSAAYSDGAEADLRRGPTFSQARAELSGRGPGPSTIKMCRKCKCEKVAMDFSPDLGKSDGLKSWCKACHRNNDRSAVVKNRERKRRWRAANRETTRLSDRAWKQANRDKARKSTRLWAKKYPDLAKVKWANDRASKKHGVGRHTAAEAKRILIKQKSRCAYCRVKLTRKAHLDHIMPLAKGGINYAKNLQWLCAPCNLRKQAKHPIIYARELGLLL